MTTATKPVVEKRLWKFTVSDYGRMIETGILKKENRVELIDGEVITMAPIGSRHAASVKRLNRLLMNRIGDDHIVGVQDPVDLNEYTEPEPDLTVAAARPDFYAEAHPRPSDIRLIRRFFSGLRPLRKGASLRAVHDPRGLAGRRAG